MKPATSFADRLTFAQYRGLSSTSHYLIFIDGWVVQHLIEIHFPNDKNRFHFDFSDKSKHIANSMEAVCTIEPGWYWEWNNAPEFFFEIEPDLPLWAAGRIQFLRDWSSDNHMAGMLIASLLEAK